MICAETQYPRVAIFANIGRMNGPSLKTRLQKSGRNQLQLGEFLGISKDSAHRLVTGKRKIGADEAEQIEQFLAGGRSTTSQPEFRRINVYGYVAAGGDDRVSIADDRVIDRIELPVGLVRDDAAFGIRVSGDSMEPRLYSGEVVIVDRDVRPHKNGDCVVELNDGTALVKQYRGERDGQLFLFQHNPEKEIRLQASSVRRIYSVIYRRS